MWFRKALNKAIFFFFLKSGWDFGRLLGPRVPFPLAAGVGEDETAAGSGRGNAAGIVNYRRFS